jgi:cytochrome P450
MVSTFGHGSHSCPAARFSITAIRIAVRHLVEAYDFTPLPRSPEPRRRQIGGVARAQHAVRVGYRPRRAASA